MKQKYLFFDIDGTLMAGGYEQIYCPESCAYALEKLKEKGYFLSIATGRSYAMARKIMDELGFVNMVHDGGNGLTKDGKLLGIEPLPHDACVRLADECDRKGIPYGFTPSDGPYRLTRDGKFQEFTNDTYLKTKEVEGLDIRDYPEVYKMYIACRRETEITIEALKALPHARFHDAYLLVEPTDKSVGIRKMVDLLGGNYEDVMVFGDADNDLNMFREEWTCVAMGNAIDELKAKADYVTSDVTEDGIYNACVHYGLIADDFPGKAPARTKK